MRHRLLSEVQDEPEVGKVPGSLNQVHDCLRSSEAVLLIIRLPAINIVCPPIQLVRHPKRPVILPARHGVRAKEDITGVPEDEWQRNGEPDQDEVRRGMRPRSFGFACRARGGFHWTEIRLREVLGVLACGDHDELLAKL
jgi:hypothetical protein